MFKRISSLFVIICFFLTTLGPLPKAHAGTVLGLPTLGTMVNLSPAYEPALIKGLTVHKDNPFLFDFILDTGNSRIAGDELKKEGDRLVKYFFACLTIPEKDLWVNLSPYEKNRMIPDALGQTALGRDLLAEDYILKQLTASLIYPEKDLGKTFWDRVYAKAWAMYGTTQIPVNTFNKVWILADKASVYEHGQTAFVVSGHLKVMLEEDYLALSRHSGRPVILSEAKDLNKLKDSSATPQNDSHSIASQIVRSIILPEIEKEVNTGKNFATLRQIFNSLILATWYKKNLKEALLNQVYANKSTVKGVNLADPSVKEQIYQQYLKAYKKGVFNYIKEDAQPDGQTIPRKYFSGGFGADIAMTVSQNPAMGAKVHLDHAYGMETVLNFNGATFGANLAMTTPNAAMNVADAAQKIEEGQQVNIIGTDPMGKLEAANLAKKYGNIPHRESQPGGFFSVNRAITDAYNQGKVSDLPPEFKQGLIGYWSNISVQSILLNNGLSVYRLQVLLNDIKTRIVLVEDTKNGSPTIVIRSEKDFQIAHAGISNQSIYLGRGLVEILEKNRPDLLNLLLTRELILLDRALELHKQKGEDYDTAVKEAEEFVQGIENELSRISGNLDQYVHTIISDFIESYFQQLAKTRYVIWDFESSLSPKFTRLVGGKSHQAAEYWADDPENNLRSFSGTAKASVDFLKSRPDILPRIEEILLNLDTSNESARVHAYEEIRSIILSIEVPAEIESAIKESYKKEVEITGQRSVAVRSSGIAEDISIHSNELQGITLGANAGQHDTYLGVVGENAAVLRWKYDVASLYTDRVLDYRDSIMVLTAFDHILRDKQRLGEIVAKLKGSLNDTDTLVAKALETRDIKIVSSFRLYNALKNNGFDAEAEQVLQARKHFINIENIAMGVTIMPMAGLEDGSFVNFGHEIASGWTAMAFQSIPEAEYKNKGRVVTISTNYNIGESIVQGKATPDTFVVHIFTDEQGEHYNILTKQLGTKTVQAVYTEGVRTELGLSEDQLLDDYIDFLRTGHLSERGLVNVESHADLSRIKNTLEKLIEANVDDTQSLVDHLSVEELNDFTYTPQQLKLLAHLLKEIMKPNNDRDARTMFTDVPKEKRDQFSATDGQVIKIAREFVKKAANYGHLIDMEGTVGINFGRAHQTVVVQRRPSNVEADVDNPDEINQSYTYVDEKDVQAALAKKQEVMDVSGAPTGLMVGQELVQGIPTRNAFSGMIYKIDDHRDLTSQFEEIKRLADKKDPEHPNGYQIIIRTTETTPDYVPILKYNNVVGVIADVGGGTSHAAVVSRELKIATVVGIQTWLNELVSKYGAEQAERIIKFLNTTGNIVTVDANMGEGTGLGVVYAGELPTQKRDINVNLPRLPKNIYTKIGYIMGMPHPMLTMSKMGLYPGYYGVALMRGEFAYAEEHVNPRFGRAYDMLQVYNYLRAQANPAFRRSLNDKVREALEKFTSVLEQRRLKREDGLPIDEDITETLLAEYKNRPSEFLRFLNPDQRRDIIQIGKSEYKGEIGRLTERLTGYLSYNEFFDAVHGGAVATMAAANNRDHNTVVYRSIDFKKNEARELIGSVVFDPTPEPSTMIGERGARWLVRPENRVILQEEVRMLLRQIARGYVNLGFMFPFVSTPGELNQLMTILEEEERAMSEALGRPIYLREVGQMIELPSNVVQADEFAHVLKRHQTQIEQWFRENFNTNIHRSSFFSFGTNDLTQLTMGADRDNPMMKYLFDESHRFVIESIRHVVNIAKEEGIKCGLCGQAIVNLVDSDPEAAEEILLLLGSTGGYAGTDYLGTLASINRSASATLRHSIVSAHPETRRILVDRHNFDSNLEKGAAARPVFVVRSKEDLKKAYLGDFIVISERAHLDLNDNETKNIITQLGSVIYTGDDLEKQMDDVRKLRIPTIKVNGDQFRQLLNLQDQEVITIDFNQKWIYRGELETKVILPDEESKIIIPKSETKPDQNISFAGSFSISDFYKTIGIHPLALLMYGEDKNKLPEETRTAIDALFQSEGVSSFQELLKKKVGQAFDANGQQGFVYRTLDLQSDDMVTLKGHELFLKESEVNPALGFAGLDAIVKDQDFLRLFRLEMRAIKSLMDENKDIAIELHSVKVPETVTSALQEIRRAGINPQRIKIGINVAWPGNYLFLKEFLQPGISFVTLNRRSLAQAYLAADLAKNGRVTETYTPSRIRRALVRPEAMVIQAANENRIPLNIVDLPVDAAMTFTVPEFLNMSQEEKENQIAILAQRDDGALHILFSRLNRFLPKPGSKEEKLKGPALRLVQEALAQTREQRGPREKSPVVDNAALATRDVGGIDLNSANMGMTVTQDANGGVQVNFDPAMIERIKAQGVFSADPVIIRITPMTPAQISPLLGLQTPAQAESAGV